MRPRFDLLLVTDEADCLIERCTALTSLSSRVAVLLRRKEQSAAAQRAEAFALRALTRDTGASLLISGDLDLALACEADGVQLPEAGPSVSEARKELGSDRLVGVSAHTLGRISAAAAAGADYATLSPVFASPGKGTPLGVGAFGMAARASALPLFALGGVDIEAVVPLLRAGAAGIAVIRAVWSAPEPQGALTSLLCALACADSPTSNSSRAHPTLAGWGDAG